MQTFTLTLKAADLTNAFVESTFNLTVSKDAPIVANPIGIIEFKSG